jgi:regulator of sirC expression with transglutaminase-like and TPR domain
MSAAVIAENGVALSQSQQMALVKLLADEDPTVYHTIRQRILDCGPSASGWLQPHLLSGEPLLRRRVQSIVEHLARRTADDRFLTFCLSQGEDLDLERGVWMLAQTRYPDINVAAYQALLDSYAADLEDRLEAGSKPRETLEHVNRYLFGELGFQGNELNYYEADNSYLNRVLDRRTGNPISLCLLFVLIARRLRLPLTGIGMPGHFLCRYQSPTEEIYIDAFNQGRLLSKADCIRYLVQTSQGFQAGFLAPAPPRRILLRICSNLHQIHQQLKQPDEAERFKRYLVALAK